MQHRYADLYLGTKLPLPSAGAGRFVGAGVACFGGVAATLWKMGPHDPGPLLGFIFYLLLATGVALLFILARRVSRRHVELMRTMIVEVNHHGLWRQTNEARDLLMGRAELRSVEVFKSRVNDIVHVELEGEVRRVRVQGLESMYHFAEDLRATFPGAAFREHRLGEAPQVSTE